MRSMIGKVPELARKASVEAKNAALGSPGASNSTSATCIWGCSLKKRPTMSWRLPMPCGIWLRKFSSRRAFSIPPVQRQKTRARTAKPGSSGA